MWVYINCNHFTSESYHSYSACVHARDVYQLHVKYIYGYILLSMLTINLVMCTCTYPCRGTL